MVLIYLKLKNKLELTMGCNHRVLVKKYKNEYYYQIHEVYYDKNGNPNSYTANPITINGESIESLNWTVDKIKECLSKPILLINKNETLTEFNNE